MVGMPMNINKRRQVIKLIALGGLACATPYMAVASSLGEKLSLYDWYGFALGAEVSIQLYHNDKVEANRIIRSAVNIIRDMEKIFSLYDETSSLTKLNKDGVIYDPSKSLVELITEANYISNITSGAFDITVQPLWDYYKQVFRKQRGGSKKNQVELDNIRDLIGYKKISFSHEKISFDQKNMAVTLNGIAQGYVTDRVAGYFKSESMTSVLIDIGEYRTLGPQADGMPWRIALADPIHMGAYTKILEIKEGAVATSSGSGDIFEPTGEYHHLFDPYTGKSSHRYSSVTVTAPKASTADALSTAFYSMSLADIKGCLSKMSNITAMITLNDGKLVTI